MRLSARSGISLLVVSLLIFGSLSVCGYQIEQDNRQSTQSGRIQSRGIHGNDFIEVVDQQQTYDCGFGVSFFHENWVAQSFVPRLPSLTKIEVNLCKAGNPSPDIRLTMHIRTQADGVNIASSTIKGGVVPNGNGGWVAFNFSNVQLTTARTHYIILEATNGSSSDEYAWLFGDNNPYPHGKAYWSDNAGSIWYLLGIVRDPDYCFKTYGLEQPPTTPIITGPASGKIREPTPYTFNASDPDGNLVQYLVDWGDGQTTGWTSENHSGCPVWINHTYKKQGSYTIRAKARDAFLAESDWGILPVQMPFSRSLSREGGLEQLFERILSLIPFMQKLGS